MTLHIEANRTAPPVRTRLDITPPRMQSWTSGRHDGICSDRGLYSLVNLARGSTRTMWACQRHGELSITLHAARTAGGGVVHTGFTASARPAARSVRDRAMFASRG